VFPVAGLSGVCARPLTSCAWIQCRETNTERTRSVAKKKVAQKATTLDGMRLHGKFFYAVPRKLAPPYVSSSLKRPIMVILSSDYGHTFKRKWAVPKTA